MPPYQPKTQPNNQNVSKFLDTVQDEAQKQDSFILLDMFKQITKEEPKMWGSSIIGFGSYHYKTKSGIEADWMQIGFSPRKQALTLYLMCGFEEYDKTGQTKNFLAKIGKHKIGKSCLYIKKLADVDLEVLKELLTFAWENAPKS
jgi:Domain of unknown function (DU1801)